MNKAEQFYKSINELIRKKFAKKFNKKYIIENGYHKIAYDTFKSSFLHLTTALIFMQFLMDLSKYILVTPEITENFTYEERKTVCLMLKKLNENIDNVNLVINDFSALTKLL
ncbi:unknown [Clostridium sp. CAG:967]|nr:unknown [Clostridium sp. CAG:967]